MAAIDSQVEAERLRHVRALLEDVLREADVCAQVVIVGRAGRFEEFAHLDASWCKAWFESDRNGVALRVRSKLTEYAGDLARQRAELEWTAGAVSGMANTCCRLALLWLEAAKAVDAATGAVHTPMQRDDPRDPR